MMDTTSIDVALKSRHFAILGMTAIAIALIIKGADITVITPIIAILAGMMGVDKYFALKQDSAVNASPQKTTP